MAKFIDKDTGWESVMTGARQVGRVEDVAVGFFDEHNATKAAVNEFGVPENNIPERPFMRTALDAKALKYFFMIEEGLGEVVDGKGNPKAIPIKVGIEARNDIINSIHSGSWAPNKASTIENKGSSKPLVDTGEMQQSVEFKVGDVGAEGGE